MDIRGPGHDGLAIPYGGGRSQKTTFLLFQKDYNHNNIFTNKEENSHNHKPTPFIRIQKNGVCYHSHA